MSLKTVHVQPLFQRSPDRSPDIPRTIVSSGDEERKRILVEQNNDDDDDVETEEEDVISEHEHGKSDESLVR